MCIFIRTFQQAHCEFVLKKNNFTESVSKKKTTAKKINCGSLTEVLKRHKMLREERLNGKMDFPLCALQVLVLLSPITGAFWADGR